MSAHSLTKSIALDGLTLTYDELGDPAKQTLLFISGWACPRSIWREQLGEFGSDYQVLSIEIPGFGDGHIPAFASSQLENQEPSFEVLAAIVAGFLEAVEAKEPILVGHSAGGLLALQCAALRPDLVRKVIGADALTFLDFYPAVDPAIIEQILAPMQTDFVGAVEGVAASYFLPTSNKQLEAELVSAMTSVEPGPALSILKAFFKADMLAMLKSYPGPVTAISAASTLDSNAVSEALGDRVTVKSIADTGHFVMLERPQEFNALLRQAIF